MHGRASMQACKEHGGMQQASMACMPKAAFSCDQEEHPGIGVITSTGLGGEACHASLSTCSIQPAAGCRACIGTPEQLLTDR
eukprot:753088-Pelagomonas_calceolata.AAC.1